MVTVTVREPAPIRLPEETPMSHDRNIKKTWHSVPTIEGAGVHLQRAFGFQHVPLFDPFLMLDHFHGDSPDLYSPGFPWHPHRGIETITYMWSGQVEHGDSMGHAGTIGPGDVQWMTAGSGIIHQEMPIGNAQGRLDGFQLWANLPRARKLMEPRYRDILQEQIPTVTLPGGASVRVICGTVAGVAGPVREIVIDPEYLDVSVPAGGCFVHPTKPGHTVLAFVAAGQGTFAAGYPEPLGVDTVCLYEPGDQVAVQAHDQGVRFLLISGHPIGEPVAWIGPIVMNTDEELQIAFAEYRAGRFLSHARPAT
jgi:quercetin 2,3-dioxygenase